VTDDELASVPVRLRRDVVRRIGHGGEAVVYELTGGRALRVYHREPHGADRMAAFYHQIRKGNPSFAVPEILETGWDGGRFFSVDRLIAGRALHELLPTLEGDERWRALASYADAAFEIAGLPYADSGFGELMRDDDSITGETWSEYLIARMERCLREAAGWLPEDVPGLDLIVEALTASILAMPPAPRVLVHGDYFPGNVLMSGELAVSGVIDFGPLTVMGDAMIDLASAVMFLEVVRPGYTLADTEYVRERIVGRVGPRFRDALTTYRGWYAVRFSPYRDDDPNLYAWCVESLRRFGVEA
jgi:aminoglycoside phosphotransferase (APT) family kinase protein